MDETADIADLHQHPAVYLALDGDIEGIHIIGAHGRIDAWGERNSWSIESRMIRLGRVDGNTRAAQDGRKAIGTEAIGGLVGKVRLVAAAGAGGRGLSIFALGRDDQPGTSQQGEDLRVAVDAAIDAAVSNPNGGGVIAEDLAQAFVLERRTPDERKAGADSAVEGIVGILTPAEHIADQGEADLRIIDLPRQGSGLAGGKPLLDIDGLAGAVGKHHLVAVSLGGRHLDGVTESEVQGETGAHVPVIGGVNVVVGDGCAADSWG